MNRRLAYTRTGHGAPVVLLHGLGSSHAAWNPVIPLLANRFDVIAVDLPGFGGSAPLPDRVEPTPVALAASVAGLLDELGVSLPNVVGNSLGGWVALELAQLRRPASLTLLSPAGMWRRGTPRYNRISLRLTRWFAEHATAAVCWLVRSRPGRIIVLGQTHGRPARVSAEHAQQAIREMGRCPGFPAALAATLDRHYVAGAPIDGPMTVLFGSRDHLLRRGSRYLAELPAGTRIAELPGCGHVPMADDPGAVAGVIADSIELAGVR